MKKSLIAISCLALLLSGGMWAQEKGKGKGKGAPAGDAAKGKMTFEGNCSGCHAIDNDSHAGGPPGLKGVTKRPKLVNDETMNDPNLQKFINEGGNGMPPFGDLLTTGEKADVIAYLKSL